MPELPWQLVKEGMRSLKERGTAGMDIWYDHKGLLDGCAPWEDLGDELFIEVSGKCQQEGHQHDAKVQQHPSCAARTDGKGAYHRAGFPNTHVGGGEPEETEALWCLTIRRRSGVGGSVSIIIIMQRPEWQSRGFDQLKVLEMTYRS